MLVMSHNVFAKAGDPWDAVARREQKPAGIIIREVEGPNWHELDHRWSIEGFMPDGEPVRAQARSSEPTRVAPLCRRMGGRRSQFPMGEHYHRAEELRGKPQPLTPEQEQLRKKQRAQVKARMTRAANRIKAERAEVARLLLGL